MTGLNHRGMFPKGCGPYEYIRDVDVSDLPADQQKYQPWDGSTLFPGFSGDAAHMMPSQREDRYVPVVGPGSYYCLGTESKELAVAIYWGFREMNVRLKGRISASNPSITMNGRGHWKLVEPPEYDTWGRRVSVWEDAVETLDAETNFLEGPWDLHAETGRVLTRDFPVAAGWDGGPGSERVYPAGDIRNIAVNGRPYRYYTSDSSEEGPEYPYWNPERTYQDFDHASPGGVAPADGSMGAASVFSFGQFGILNRASLEGGGLIRGPGDGVVPFWDGKYWFSYGCITSVLNGNTTVFGGWWTQKPGTPFPHPHPTPYEGERIGGVYGYDCEKTLNTAIGIYGYPSEEHIETEPGSMFNRVRENIPIPVKMIVGDESLEGVMNGFRDRYDFSASFIPEDMKPDLTVTGLAVEIELKKYHTLGGLRDEESGEAV